MGNLGQIFPMKRAFSYIRWSSSQQTWGDSERRQESGSIAYCKKHGLTLIDTFADKGVSAKAGKNLERSWADLIKLLRSGDYLLVEDQDRITRQDPLVLLNSLKAITDMGVTVVTVKDGMEITKQNFFSAGIFIQNALKGVLSKGENDKRIFRLKEKWEGRREAIKAGKFAAMPGLPAWIRNGNGKFEVIPEAAQTVREIFKLYLAGNGCFSICGILNEKKVPTLTEGRKNSNGWNFIWIQRLLRNKAVIGYYAPKNGKLEQPNIFPPIVDEATYYAAVAKLKERVHFSGRRAEANNLFGGLCVCSVCGGNLIRHTAHGTWYLICSNSRGRKCDAGGIRFDKFQHTFLEALFEQQKFLDAISKEEQAPSKLDEIKGRLTVAETTLAKFVERFKEDPSKTLAQLIKDAETQQETLKTELEEETVKEKGSTPFGEAYDTYLNRVLHVVRGTGQTTVEDRLGLRETIRAMVNTITVNRKEKSYSIQFKGAKRTLDVQFNAGEGFTVDGKTYQY